MRSRGEAWALTLISMLFVLAGVFLIVVTGETGTGLVAIVFFGACLVVGLVQLASHGRGGGGRPTGPVALLVMALASFALGVACLLMLGLALVEPESIASPSRSPVVAVVVGAVGTVFFGGGSGVIAVSAIYAARRR